MASIHHDPWVDKLYSIATDRDHAYMSDPQMASSLLSSVTDILQSTGISDKAALKLAISYIHFDSAHNSGYSPLLYNGNDSPQTAYRNGHNSSPSRCHRDGSRQRRPRR